MDDSGDNYWIKEGLCFRADALLHGAFSSGRNPTPGYIGTRLMEIREFIRELEIYEGRGVLEGDYRFIVKKKVILFDKSKLEEMWNEIEKE